jgi:hypothetical protein
MGTPTYIAKRQRAFKRWRKKNWFKFHALVVLSLAGLFTYAGYIGNEQINVNPDSYKPLLSVIGEAESNGDYNAYFGRSGRSDVEFTNMSVADVLKWQDEYVASGSPSSAVGRYQFINTTLKGLVDELGIKPTQKFDPPTQDRLAITLLERRGSISYIKKELSQQQFAANLAKEWAGLPKMTGKNPELSYYAGDGLNKSRVAPHKVLKAIEPIEAD